MRRLRRICAAVGNRRVRFISCSATVANPQEHFRTIFGVKEVTLVDFDGSPSGRKEFLCWNTPYKDPKDPASGRGNAKFECARLFCALMLRGVRLIAFCRVRAQCEALVSAVKQELESLGRPECMNLVMGYRGGYTAADRRRIESEMFEGKLLGIVATTALELGIDIGTLDCVMSWGFPYTIANLRQQSGRAGRRNKDSLSILVGDCFPTDQHYMQNPEELFTKPNCQLRVDLDNLLVREGHIQCAAYEMPIRPEQDAQYFGHDLSSICNERLVKDEMGYYHCHDRFRPNPSRYVAIRDAEDEHFAIVDITNGRNVVLEELEASRATFTIYDGAMFLHQGNTYLVRDFIPDKLMAKVEKAKVDWTTTQRDYTDIDPIEIEAIRKITSSLSRAYYGAIKIQQNVFGYFKVDKKGRVLDAVQVDNPPVIRYSKGLWLDVPKNALDILQGRRLNSAAAIHAAEHAVMSLLPTFVISMPEDVRTECKVALKEFAKLESKRKRPARLTFYDAKGGAGGSGISTKAFDHIGSLLRIALERVEACQCQRGCMECVASETCRESNEVMSKAGCLVVLKSLLNLPIDIDQLPMGPEDSVPVGMETVTLAHPVRVRVQDAKKGAGVLEGLENENRSAEEPKSSTAFIKRLRTAVTPSNLATFLQEIRSLSLHKYLSEIIAACYEGLCRVKSPAEIEAGVEIVSALHQRFGPPEFTEYLAWLLGKGMATPDKSALKNLTQEVREKEEKERMTRQRALLRVITELWLVGVLRTLDDAVKPEDASKAATGKAVELKPRPGSGKAGSAEPFPLEVLKDLLAYDREHTNLPLLVIFVKAFSWEILGVRPASSDGRKSIEEDGAASGHNDALPDVDDGAKTAQPADQHPFTPPDTADKFKSILKRYFEDVVAHIVRDQKSIQSQARRNAEAYVKSGEVFEDRQANYEKQVKTQERLVSNAQVIADAIGAEIPELKEPDDSLVTSSGSIGLVKTSEFLRGSGDGNGIWADEDERRFYENIVDLKGKVPPILLEDGKKKKPDGDDQVGRKVEPNDISDVPKSAPEAVDDQSTSIVNKTIGAQVDALLARLPELTNKDIIDQTAIDFCFLNSKASRNRLVKALTEVPKGRSDLLPSWARLVATLGRYMPDVPKGLVDYLDAEFRSLQRRKEKDFLGQVRLSNIRYLAELTKFGVVPEHVVFHCLKVSLDDFSRMNIEILCNLVENCGRYLLKNPETAPRMASFLETLQRKKSVQHIGQPERMLIDNAVYYVDPPQRPAIEQKERTPMELFIRKLVYSDITKRNYSKILKQIRRLHWEEAEVVAILEKVFSKPGRVKYGNIHLLGILLSALYRYHPEFVVRIIDNVIESVSFGLEQNDFRLYQRRIAEVKYLGELYNYRVLEHPVIFDTLYKILTFGYGELLQQGLWSEESRT
ncbi:hypothetical protein UVI_02043420 [Ustilaginoidea virens]|uniref:Helicase C-terminal domain-containing protein n=1 Tax=Ustilaginoidea virens TaxID=1159556 RepID=A0A1B5KXG1_USTVR|nr:hypothetical protein UVI_02043420 [Ustilaginoidea virens]